MLLPLGMVVAGNVGTSLANNKKSIFRSNERHLPLTVTRAASLLYIEAALHGCLCE